MGAGMLTPEESAHLLDLNQRLRRATAQRHKNHARLAELQTEIDELSEDCDKVLEIADTNYGPRRNRRPRGRSRPAPRNG
jgi:hypothetical protein